MTEFSTGAVTRRPIPWHKWLRPGMHIMCSHMTAEPRVLLQSLAGAELPDTLSIELGVPFSMDAEAFTDKVDLHVMGGMGSAAALARKRPLTIVRKEYHAFAEDYANGVCKADIVLVSLAMAEDGSLHLGASQGAAVDAARDAEFVIAEINSAAPVISSSAWPVDIPITHQFHCDYPLATVSVSAGSVSAGRREQESKIAGHLANVIPDRACLQVGIGAIPAAILSSLQAHQHLGIHTGMLGDSLYQLIERGVVDNSAKPAGLQKSIAGCIYGEQRLYRAVENDPTVELAHLSVTHVLSTLQRIDNFTAVNSAIEIDLQGRVNAETAPAADGSRRSVGGIGGLPAFVRGALHSKGGQSIIALPSLTRYDGSGHSRIVESLSADITLDESLADIVVTEHGVARLRGASAEQRRQRMLDICSPEARELLFA